MIGSSPGASVADPSPMSALMSSAFLAMFAVLVATCVDRSEPAETLTPFKNSPLVAHSEMVLEPWLLHGVPREVVESTTE